MSYQPKPPEHYKAIFQQDPSDLLMCAEMAEITPEALLDYSVRLLAHLPIDVYAPDANDASGPNYRSKVTPPKLSAPGHYRNQQDVRVIDRFRALFDAGTDPLEILCHGAHAAGIDYMIRLRMNDLHDVVGLAFNIAKHSHRPTDPIGEPIYYTNQWKLDHPECLIGDPADATPPNTFSYWQRSAMNYALAPVRHYIFAMAQELVTGYDLDILELDFIRFAFYFHRAEAYAQRHVLTELVRRIRKLCREEGGRRGRPVRLSARVPDTLELGLRCGIDTAGWLSEGLLDMVIIGGGYADFATPWRQITDVARQAGVPAFACLNKAVTAGVARVQHIRAAAHRAYAAGATGVKLWNCFYYFPYHNPKGTDPAGLEFVRELADPATLRRREMTFAADAILDPDTFVGSAHFHQAWNGQVPMTIGLAADGIGQSVTFDIPEHAAGRQPSDEASLTAEIGNFWPHDDRLELYWNSRRLDNVQCELLRLHGRERHRLTCAVPCGSIRAGENLLELRLVHRDPRLDPFISLWSAELTVPEIPS